MDRPSSSSSSPDNSRNFARRNKFSHERLNNSKNTEVYEYMNIGEVKNDIRNTKHREDRIKIFVNYSNQLQGKISRITEGIKSLGDSFQGKMEQLHRTTCDQLNKQLEASPLLRDES